MSEVKFHISQFEPSLSDIASLQGFAPDLHECLINLGLRQDIVRILDTEFTINMGVLCTSLTIMATENTINSDWRFSQFGLLYIANEQEFYSVKGKDESIVIFNHTEFSLLIPILACRDNILSALAQGFKNPFRMSLFYQNFLIYCLRKLDKLNVDSEKVLLFLENHKREDFKKHELFFDHYLDLELK